MKKAIELNFGNNDFRLMNDLNIKYPSMLYGNFS